MLGANCPNFFKDFKKCCKQRGEIKNVEQQSDFVRKLSERC